MTTNKISARIEMTRLPEPRWTVWYRTVKNGKPSGRIFYKTFGSEAEAEGFITKKNEGKKNEGNR